MAANQPKDLRILVADERRVYLAPVSNALSDLGHEVIAVEVDIPGVAKATAAHQPDVAIVALHDDTDHALELITEIMHDTDCPVMALVEDANPDFIARAADRGIFAHLDSADHDELRGAINVALNRFEEYERLRQAFGRRARIERAKGMLMERDGLDEQQAFERLRAEARSSRRRLIDVVEEYLDDARAGASGRADQGLPRG
ncbi:MAG: ANTAR domain-containing response regulator [Thermoleophilaceae bacterium]|jgi:response regulator NasT